ncbi:MAG: hypothetical protein K2M07_00905 [Muribaculaceae bacterium]|nr:hypothetical protein [Muribaculaceae bacterium]
MKKFLLALAGVFLLSVFTADAAKVYYENNQGWATVGTWLFGGNGAGGGDMAGTTEVVEIDGHTLYMADTNYAKVIFRNGNNWGQGQTGDITIVDGAVWTGGQGTTQQIANIVGGQYVSIDDPTPANQDLYLRGSFDQYWGMLEPYKFTKEEDGTYKLTLTDATALTAGTEVKIGSDGWGIQWGGDPSLTGDSRIKLEPGKVYTLTNVDNASNMIIAEDMYGATWSLNPETKELTISDNQGEMPTEKWWCAWDLSDGNGWQFGQELEEQAEGTFKVVVNANAASGTNYFAVFQGFSNENFDDGRRYGPAGGGDLDITGTTEPIKMQTGNGTFVLKKNGTWTVVIDPTDQANTTISFDYGDSTGEANIMINDRTETGYDSKYYPMEALADTDDDDYTWSGQIGAEDEVMFSIHGVTYGYDPSIINSIEEDDATGNLIIVYPLSDENPQYVRFDFDSNVTFNVNISNKTVTLIQTDPAHATINITKANGASGIHRMNLISGSTDSYATIHTITFEEGDCVDFRLGDKRYNPVFSDVNVLADATAVPFTLEEAPDGEAAPEWKGTMGSPVYVRINNDLTGVVQSDVPTGVEAVVAEEAEAVYYNLQGIRVDNPEKGIFIKVNGNKAVKVAM